jgi:hypothetical protein
VNETTSLATIAAATRMLAEARTLEDLRLVRDVAEALKRRWRPSIAVTDSRLRGRDLHKLHGRSSPLASALVSAVRLDSTPPEPFAITTGPTSLVEAHAPGRPGVLDQ